MERAIGDVRAQLRAAKTELAVCRAHLEETVQLAFGDAEQQDQVVRVDVYQDCLPRNEESVVVQIPVDQPESG